MQGCIALRATRTFVTSIRRRSREQESEIRNANGFARTPCQDTEGDATSFVLALASRRALVTSETKCVGAAVVAVLRVSA